MFEFFTDILRWRSLDYWMVTTAALAAMSCALPGVFLLLKRQSLMGDALSHTILLGVVLGVLGARGLASAGFLPDDLGPLGRHAAMFVGAVLVGVLTALLTELVQRRGKVEASAALGVVFTSLFALGLLLLRLAADNVHIDPNCVLYGAIEELPEVLPSFLGIPASVLPITAPIAVNGLLLIVNLLLTVLFFKELRICAFDPQLADSLGIPSRAVHYGLMAVTSATLVAGFESVGAILVIALVIVPAATARLLTSRLPTMIALALATAALSAPLGHHLARTLPRMIFTPLGYPSVTDASTAGMMAVACGLMFLAAVVFAPRQGVVSRLRSRWRLSMRIAREDLLASLYRAGEGAPSTKPRGHEPRPLGGGTWKSRLAVWQLRRRGQLLSAPDGWRLTEAGRTAAAQVIRSHRLWESFVAEHFELPAPHVHAAAERAEHFLDPALSADLEKELDSPTLDPHGKQIPR